LELNIYKSLGSPIAKKLYRYLDKRRHSNPSHVELDLFQLVDVLPITSSFPSKLQQVLEEPHKQLIQVGFLKDIHVDKDALTGSWRIVYLFPRDMPEIPRRAPHDPQALMLINRGVSRKVAEFLAKQYPARIPSQVEVFDWLCAHNGPQVKHNPSGYLRKAIEDNYTPPAGFLSQKERQATIEKGIHENQRRKEMAAAEEADRRKLKAQIEQIKTHLSRHELQQFRKEAESNVNPFIRDRIALDRVVAGELGYSAQVAIEYELDRLIEARYLLQPHQTSSISRPHT
jgi:hypothetical protein